MQEICKKESCTGCFACMSNCRHQAITTEKDVCGFLYPVIDQDKCVDCGLCQKVCPVLHPTEKQFPTDCFAVRVKDEDELATCASGGAATAMSRYVLEKGGVVYGCTGKNIRDVRHIRVTTVEELSLLKGSKYVQSYMGTIMRQVKNDLKNRKRVLFIGTPCQIGGLQTFLGKDYDNLLTADLVCHGVPSQQLLNDNIAYYEQQGIEMKYDSVHFREKKNFNSAQFAKIEFGWFFNKKQPNSTKADRTTYYKDPYMFGFIQGLFFRNSCYRCPYAYAYRSADLTLSDYWGLGKDSSLNVGRGASAVLVNTEKGKSFIDAMQGAAVMERRDVVEAISGNGQLKCPSRRHVNYQLFRQLYPEYGLAYAVRMCLKRDLKIVLIKDFVTFVRKFVKI